MVILDLEATWEESEPRTPLVCILSTGSDPTTQITALSKVKSISKSSRRVWFKVAKEFHTKCNDFLQLFVLFQWVKAKNSMPEN